MRRTILLVCCLSALTAACGSQTVGPSPDDAAVLPDGSPIPGVDASNPPPRVDGAVPDALVPPTPDASTPPRDACARACDRAARDCGRADPACLRGCNDSLARLPPACAPRFVALTECLAINGFLCSPMGNTEPSAACRPAVEEVQRCLGDTPPPPPPPPPVDGGVEPEYPGCAAACDQIARACGAAKPDCVANCSSTGFEARVVCPGVFDEFLTCVDRNRFTCVDGNPAVPRACADLSGQLEMCLSGGGGGDPPPVPPTADAGAPAPDA